LYTCITRKVDPANFTKKDIVEAVPHIINAKGHLWNTLTMDYIYFFKGFEDFPKDNIVLSKQIGDYFRFTSNVQIYYTDHKESFQLKNSAELSVLVECLVTFALACYFPYSPKSQCPVVTTQVNEYILYKLLKHVWFDI
jgi:hypothetical protein